MLVRAQTNTRLFLELHAAGWPAAELRRVRDAYVLAMRLYSGLYAGCGRPTITHEIGTASLAHRYGGSHDMVVASLLHGAYIAGDWGHLRVRVTPRKRAQLRRVVGERAEALIYAFRQPDWPNGAIHGFAARAADLSPMERDVAFLRLVEELDRLLDYGAILCFRDPDWMKEYFRAARRPLCILAETLGRPDLAAALGEAVDATLAADLPAELMRLEFPGEGGFRVVQPSYRRRLGLRVYQAIAGQGRRAERQLRGWLAAQLATGLRRAPGRP